MTIYSSYISSTSMPAVPTSFVTQVNSPAIPIANVLNVSGGTSTANTTTGIRTDGSSGSNTLTVQLTNRVQGTGNTVGAVTGDIVTLALGATPGTYTLEFRVSGFEATTPLGAGYSIFGTVRTTGGAAVLVGTPDKIVNEEGGLSAGNADLVVSGNNAILRVTGVAALTINWSVVGLYTFAP